MTHNHSHGHAHGTGNYNQAFAIGIALNLGFVIVEATYVWLILSRCLPMRGTTLATF